MNTRSFNCCLATVLGAFGLVGLMGCDNGPVVSSVHGKVTLDGAPLANANLLFSPEKAGRSSLGRTDANGEYKLLFNTETDGALVGKMKVRITTAEEYTDSRDRTRLRPEKLPAKYNEQSELTADVELKDNVINFDLQSK
jgi:hypothetical protein